MLPASVVVSVCFLPEMHLPANLRSPPLRPPGLSSLELLRAFPGCTVTAMDLSPHFLAVGGYQQQNREVRACPC